MNTPKEILRLIDQFEQNLDSYKAGQYNETQLRREFLDPFFKALGWDVDNTQGLAEAYKDVVHEDAIRIGGAVKAPDYCFRIGGTRKFFLEAKKPSIAVGEETTAAYQLRRYAWSAKLPLSILSDFEEFAVYDCRIKPNKPDSAATARVFICGFLEYPEKWEWISSIFSKDAVLKGSFDKYAETNKAKRGTAEVDDDFLATIEHWRSELARNLALRNSRLSQRELNFAVQRIIDRIVFLRICEDRGIELYGRLLALTNGPNIYGRLCEVFEDADGKYNSGLFYFTAEKGRHERPDEITLGLDVDDKLLHDLLRGLYYPESPYEFTVLSADILGQVYEQFLGKVIRLTAGHHAVVEEKPQVKKAGGVYYTPTYIVDYIVRQTVGKLVEGKIPKQVAKLRVLDPACGSGSFLINAYQFLLDWHHDWYLANKPERWTKGRNPVLVQTTSGWKLTVAERKKILLDNIYGVDIDPQAVEVTKLSLLLKVLEGESEQTIQPFLRLFRQRALPDLGGNIKCGNSLIGPEAFQQAQLSLLPEAEQYRINIFDWTQEFPEIMQKGGFDAIIGNPPYVRIQTMKEWAPVEVELYKALYRSASSGNYDIYVVFVEKALSLLNKAGRMGFILPHKFFNSQYGEALRDIISKGKHLSHIVHFGDQQIFAGAATYTCLLFLDKVPSRKCQFIKVAGLAAWRAIGQATEGTIFSSEITAAEWNFAVGKTAALFERLRKMPVKLGDIAHIFVGTQTSADDIFVLDDCSVKNKIVAGVSKALGKEVKVEISCTKLFLRGKDIRRYEPAKSNARLICPYEITEDNCRLFTEFEMSDHPLALAYLEANKIALMSRERGKFKSHNWYAYGYPKSMHLFQKPKLVVPDYNNVPSFTVDNEGHFYKTGYGIIVTDYALSPLYVLGLLNSALLFRYLLSIGTSLRGGYVRFWTQFIQQLPIRKINFSDPNDAPRYDRMVRLVQHMLDLHKQLPKTKTPHEKEALQRQIDGTDIQIDQLVYQLYGLTSAEIKVIEKAN
jgi:hypothetical protein